MKRKLSTAAIQCHRGSLIHGSPDRRRRQVRDAADLAATGSAASNRCARSSGERHLFCLRQQRSSICREDVSGGYGPVEVGGIGSDVAGL